MVLYNCTCPRPGAYHNSTSVIIAVIAGEPEKARLITVTDGAELLAPESLHGELGNALAAQLRRGRLGGDVVPVLLRAYRQIPIQFVEVSARLSGSPLDVEGADLGWSREEIVAAVREGRER